MIYEMSYNFFCIFLNLKEQVLFIRHLFYFFKAEENLCQ